MPGSKDQFYFDKFKMTQLGRSKKVRRIRSNIITIGPVGDSGDECESQAATHEHASHASPHGHILHEYRNDTNTKQAAYHPA